MQYTRTLKYRLLLLSNLGNVNNVMPSRWNIALPWKHYTKYKLHELVHLLQIQYVNVFCENATTETEALEFN